MFHDLLSLFHGLRILPDGLWSVRIDLMHKLLGADLASSACVEDPDGRDQILVDPHLTVGDHVNPVLRPRGGAPVVGVRQLFSHHNYNLSSFPVAGAACVAEAFGSCEFTGLDGVLDQVIGRGIGGVGFTPAIEENFWPFSESTIHFVADSSQHRHGPSGLVFEHHDVGLIPNPAFLRMKEPPVIRLHVNAALQPIILDDRREIDIGDVDN
jgi:hypothetical protein